MKDDLDVFVINEGTRAVLYCCATVKEAEAFIAGIEVAWPTCVHRGDFGIDAPEEKLNPKEKKS